MILQVTLVSNNKLKYVTPGGATPQTDGATTTIQMAPQATAGLLGAGTGITVAPLGGDVGSQQIFVVTDPAQLEMFQVGKIRL